MERKQNFQNIAWFWDLYRRERLDLNPSYQRRSVWNNEYKNYFIDTILMKYPAPAIFLYEDIDVNGFANYHVVDGKQRLTTIFDFAQNEFSLWDKATSASHKEKFFDELDDQVKKDFWSYQFSVEYLPTDNELIINDIFDRINRNVAKLSPQELRHAKFNGDFITTCEKLTDILNSKFNEKLPRITSSARRQMKDVEFAAHLLLLIENGPRGYSTSSLDQIFAEKDENWELSDQVEALFEEIIEQLQLILDNEDESGDLLKTRMVNQADFYTLFGVLGENIKHEIEFDPQDLSTKLKHFYDLVSSEDRRDGIDVVKDYYEYTRSASNDTGARKARHEIISRLFDGSLELGEGENEQ